MSVSTIIVKGDCVGEIYPVCHAQTDAFSHFRYVISRLNEEHAAVLLDGVARDIAAAKKAVIAALDGIDAERGGASGRLW